MIITFGGNGGEIIGFQGENKLFGLVMFLEIVIIKLQLIHLYGSWVRYKGFFSIEIFVPLSIFHSIKEEKKHLEMGNFLNRPPPFKGDLKETVQCYFLDKSPRLKDLPYINENVIQILKIHNIANVHQLVGSILLRLSRDEIEQKKTPEFQTTQSEKAIRIISNWLQTYGIDKEISLHISKTFEMLSFWSVQDGRILPINTFQNLLVLQTNEVDKLIEHGIRNVHQFIGQILNFSRHTHHFATLGTFRSPFGPQASGGCDRPSTCCGSHDRRTRGE